MRESSKNSYSDRISKVCEYIYQNLDNDLSLTTLSQLANFSKYHFHRQFSAYVGVSVFQFVQLMRLKRASYQLAFSKLAITEIAYQAQFENPESFSRAFKKQFAQTPTEFRKQPSWPDWHSKYQFTITASKSSNNMQVKIIDFEKTPVAILEHRDIPDKVNESANKFLQWRKQSGLSPIKTSKTYGVIYDDPKIVNSAEFRFDICGSLNLTPDSNFEIPANPQGVKAGYIAANRCAVVTHHGSHETLENSVYYLYQQWLPESGEQLSDNPCFFHYLNLMPEVDEHELVTDIYLPLK